MQAADLLSRRRQTLGREKTWHGKITASIRRTRPGKDMAWKDHGIYTPHAPAKASMAVPNKTQPPMFLFFCLCCSVVSHGAWLLLRGKETSERGRASDDAEDQGWAQ
jgi:hypothetical protein